jgi:hypothetical protein
MTTFGWDASNYDDAPTVRDGIDFYTHKAGEGHHTYYDREYGASLNNAKNLGIPILGAYFVNHPGSVADQVDWFVQILDQDTPWWRKHECFILQIDAEKFDYMPSAPTKDEIQAFGDRLVSVHGVDPRRVIAYAPQWLYGNTLTGLTYRLWASAYGGNPVGHYLAVYPGDADVKRWQSYSGQSPLILQYGSNTTIGNQTTCDANAFRGTLQQLMETLGSGSPEPEDEMNIKGLLCQTTDEPDGNAQVRAWVDPVLGPVYENIVSADYRAMWIAQGFVANPKGDNWPVKKLSDLGKSFSAAQKEYYDALRAGGSSGGGANFTWPNTFTYSTTTETTGTITPND